MKNYILTILTFSVFICHSQKKIHEIPQKKVIELKNNTACGKSELQSEKVDYWYNENQNFDKSRYSDFKKVKSLIKVKKYYQIKNGLLFFNNKIVSDLKVNYQVNDSVEYNIKIEKGKPKVQIIEISGNPKPSMLRIIYDNGDSNYKFLKHSSFLNKGNGELKLYYYEKWNYKTQKFNIEKIKEEGKVKNNYKFGDWKYYNKKGSIDSTKAHLLKDSIDIRFPYSLFNKKR